MEKPFNLSIIDPEKIVYSGQVVSLIAPAVLGYLGVLANHAGLVANIADGKIILRESSGESKIFYYRGKGFLGVFKNNVNLILRESTISQDSSKSQ